MDDKWQAVLDKVVLLCSQNPEFDSILRKRLGINANRTIPIAENNDKSNRIEKYLGLDYSVDAQNSVIDYSYIKIKVFRNDDDIEQVIKHGILNQNEKWLVFVDSKEYGKILEKKSQRGKKYFGCEHNPTCDFMSWDTPLAKETCPKCGGLLLQKNGRAKKVVCYNEQCDFERKL